MLKALPARDRELAFARVFQAPRERVWEHFVDPRLVPQWLLGPPGWTMPVCEIDLRRGGRFRYVWRNDDGREMGMSGEYLAVVRPERVVHTELFDEDWTGGETTVTTVFHERNGVTEMELVVRYPTSEVRERVKGTGMEAGMEAGYARLDALLAAR